MVKQLFLNLIKLFWKYKWIKQWSDFTRPATGIQLNLRNIFILRKMLWKSTLSWFKTLNHSKNHELKYLKSNLKWGCISQSWIYDDKIVVFLVFMFSPYIKYIQFAVRVLLRWQKLEKNQIQGADTNIQIDSLIRRIVANYIISQLQVN